MPSDPGSIPAYSPQAPTGFATNTAAAGVPQAQQPKWYDIPLYVGRQPATGYVPTTGGKYAADTGAPASPAHVYATTQPVFMSATDILNQFDSMGREQFLKIRNAYIAAGLVAPGADPYTVRAAFYNVLQDVAQATASGVKISPQGFVNNLIKMNGIDPSTITADPNYVPPGTPETADPNRTEKYVQRNVTDITEGQAWSSLQNTLSQMLGRDPSDQEMRDFTYRMNRLAAENPAISRTVTKYKNGEAVSSSTHTNPGFTSADMAESAYDSAQNDPEYAEYRGASYLFNAVLSALGPLGG